MKFYKQPWIGLAFSVFAVGNVYADTVIASKDYVDTAVGAKQDKLTTTNVVSSGSGNVVIDVTASDGTVTVTKGSIDVSGAVSDGANALNLTSSTTKAPTVKAVQGSVLYVGNTASANTKTESKAISDVSANANVFNTNSTIKADSDAYVPSVAAVEARVKGAINALDVAQVSSTGKPIMTIKQDDGKITATTGQITNAGVATGAGITTDKMGAITGYTKATTNAALAATDTLNTALGKLERKADDASSVATSIKDNIAHQGNYTADWNDSTVTTSDDASKVSNLGAAKASQDTYIPTMAAVEHRVKTAETAASNALSNLAVTSAMITDGTIAAADLGSNAVTSAKIKDLNVTTAKLADSAVTTGKLAADAVTNAKLADNAVQTENVVDKSLKYQNDMNNTALYDINTGAVPASDVCTKTAPCMLTYYKEGSKVYTRWTPLDADGLSANAATTDMGASI